MHTLPTHMAEFDTFSKPRASAVGLVTARISQHYILAEVRLVRLRILILVFPLWACMIRLVYGSQIFGLTGQCSIFGTVIVKWKPWLFKFPARFEVNTTV